MMKAPAKIKPMKSKFNYRLYANQGNEDLNLVFEDLALAKQYYGEKLHSMQLTGQSFHINLQMFYHILEGNGGKNLTRSYLLAAHNEKGIFNPEGIKDDLTLIEQHIESGFISHTPERFVFKWPSPWVAALKLDNGRIVGAYDFTFGFQRK